MTWPPRRASYAQLMKAVALLSAVVDALALPAMTLACGGLSSILWLGAWSQETEGQRVNYLGAALLGCIAIIALGYLRTWKYVLRGLRGKFGAAELDLDMDNAKEPQA